VCTSKTNAWPTSISLGSFSGFFQSSRNSHHDNKPLKYHSRTHLFDMADLRWYRRAYGATTSPTTYRLPLDVCQKHPNGARSVTATTLARAVEMAMATEWLSMQRKLGQNASRLSYIGVLTTSRPCRCARDDECLYVFVRTIHTTRAFLHPCGSVCGGIA